MASKSDKKWNFDYVCMCPKLDAVTNSFVDEHCIVFDNEDENKLAYSEIHHEFRRLVDRVLCDRLAELGFSIEGFCDIFVSSDVTHGPKKKVYDHIRATDSFTVFKTMMVARNNELKKEALQALSKFSPPLVWDATEDVEEAASPDEVNVMLEMDFGSNCKGLTENLHNGYNEEDQMKDTDDMHITECSGKYSKSRTKKENTHTLEAHHTNNENGRICDSNKDVSSTLQEYQTLDEYDESTTADRFVDEDGSLELQEQNKMLEVMKDQSTHNSCHLENHMLEKKEEEKQEVVSPSLLHNYDEKGKNPKDPDEASARTSAILHSRTESLMNIHEIFESKKNNEVSKLGYFPPTPPSIPSPMARCTENEVNKIRDNTIAKVKNTEHDKMKKAVTKDKILSRTYFLKKEREKLLAEADKGSLKGSATLEQREDIIINFGGKCAEQINIHQIRNNTESHLMSSNLRVELATRMKHDLLIAEQEKKMKKRSDNYFRLDEKLKKVEEKRRVQKNFQIQISSMSMKEGEANTETRDTNTDEDFFGVL